MAFQAGSPTLDREMPSSLGRAGRGTGLDHGEGEFSPGGPRDRRAGAVALSSLAHSVSVLLESVRSSRRTTLSTARKMRRFFDFSSHFVSFRPIHFYLIEAGFGPDVSDERAHQADRGFLQIILRSGARCAPAARRANRTGNWGPFTPVYGCLKMLESLPLSATFSTGAALARGGAHLLQVE